MKVVETARRNTTNEVEFLVTLAFDRLDANVLTDKKDPFFDGDESRLELLALVRKALDALNT